MVSGKQPVKIFRNKPWLSEQFPVGADEVLRAWVWGSTLIFSDTLS